MLAITEMIENLRFLDIKLIDVEDFAALLIRLVINLVFTYFVVFKVYYKSRKDKDYVFTFYIFNVLIFFVCYLMSSVKLDIGFAFGLFALFAILRYRTTTVPVKEMTYLFAIIALAVVNSITTKKVSYAELFFTNFCYYRIHLFRRENLV